MRDIDERDALLLQHTHHFKKLVYLLDRKGGGGLVQNDHLCVVGDRLCDLTHLPLGNGHVPHGLGEVYGHTELSEKLRGLFLHSAFIDNAHGVDRITTQKQVVDHVPLKALVQLLMDHCDTVFQSILGT